MCAHSSLFSQHIEIVHWASSKMVVVLMWLFPLFFMCDRCFFFFKLWFRGKQGSISTINYTVSLIILTWKMSQNILSLSLSLCFYSCNGKHIEIWSRSQSVCMSSIVVFIIRAFIQWHIQSETTNWIYSFWLRFSSHALYKGSIFPFVYLFLLTHQHMQTPQRVENSGNKKRTREKGFMELMSRLVLASSEETLMFKRYWVGDWTGS